MTIRHRRLLTVILTFNAATAFMGGVALLAQSGKTTPAMLSSTPFDSFIIPALLLIFIVGVSALVALIAISQDVKQAVVIAFASGIIMCGWIVGELLLIRQFSWLQVLYFVLGAGVVSLSYPFHHHLLYRYGEKRYGT